MPTSTYDLIASNVLGSSASSIEFASISSSYRDLVIVVTATNSSLAQLRVRPNGQTTNLSSVTAEGNGSTTASVATEFTAARYVGSTRYDGRYTGRPAYPGTAAAELCGRMR